MRNTFACGTDVLQGDYARHRRGVQEVCGVPLPGCLSGIRIPDLKSGLKVMHRESCECFPSILPVFLTLRETSLAAITLSALCTDRLCGTARAVLFAGGVQVRAVEMPADLPDKRSRP